MPWRRDGVRAGACLGAEREPGRSTLRARGRQPVTAKIIPLLSICAFLIVTDACMGPLGVNLFPGNQFAGSRVERTANAILPFVFTPMRSVLIVIFFPQISL